MTTHPLHTTALRQFLSIATAAIFSLTGCSDRPPKRDPRAEQMNTAAAKPTMAAQDSFFDGKLLVEANLGQGFGTRGGPGDDHGRQGRPGGGGGQHGGGGRRRGPGGGEPGGSDIDRMPEPGGGSGGSFSIRESTLPPVALHLRLTNQSTEAIEVTFLLCKSELGDFAVRPEKLTVAPGQSAEPEAMTSRLGLMSGELHLAVRLRMKDKTEQKDLVLKIITPAEPPPSAKP